MDIGFTSRMFAGMAVIIAVLCVLGLLARGGWRPRLGGGPDRLMLLIDSLALPGAATVHVVKIAEHYYVLGRSGNHITKLGELPAAGVEQWVTTREPRAAIGHPPLAGWAMNVWRPRG
jgi:flagellar biogenesis protein FliO